MQQTRFRIEFPGQRGPLQGWLAVLLAAVGFVVAMTLGVVFFLFFLALALVVMLMLRLMATAMVPPSGRCHRRPRERPSRQRRRRHSK